MNIQKLKTQNKLQPRLKEVNLSGIQINKCAQKETALCLLQGTSNRSFLFLVIIRVVRFSIFPFLSLVPPLFSSVVKSYLTEVNECFGISTQVITNFFLFLVQYVAQAAGVSFKSSLPSSLLGQFLLTDTADVT